MLLNKPMQYNKINLECLNFAGKEGSHLETDFFTGNKTMASNGHILLEVENKGEGLTTDQQIEVANFKRFKLNDKTNPTFELVDGAIKTSNGWTYPLEGVGLVAMPEYATLLPTVETLAKEYCKVTLNPKYLLIIAKTLMAIKKDDRHPEISFWVHKENRETALIFEGTNPQTEQKTKALIMPIIQRP